MTALQRELWSRLAAFSLDDPDASLSFSRRLARENGWTHAFAQRVLDEYKRFVLLAMTAGHQVTPSDEVDQAWHLHLTYSRSYWDELCGGVLGRPLHHGPTKGGKQEGDRFEEQYERTLDSYHDAFGEAPPADIWPPSEVRFGEASDFVRVNRQRAWITPKPWRLSDRRPLALAGCWLLMAPTLAAGAAWNVFDFDGATFLKFYAWLGLLGLIASWICRLTLRTRYASPTEDKLPEAPSELGVLRGGWKGAFHAAMAGLLAEESLIHKERSRWNGKESRFVAVRQPNESDTAIQREILSRAKDSNAGGAKLSELSAQARPNIEAIEQDLAERGLLETGSTFASVQAAVGLIMAAVLGTGVIKLVVGVARDKPVGFLIASLVVLGIATILLIRRPLRTAAGNQALALKKVQKSNLVANAKLPVSSLTPAEIALAVGLLGVAECQAVCPKGLQDAIRSTSASSGGCGSGDGGCGGGGGGDGGGCGGGCGGCGGD